jgi:regulator of RNase E activity RraA
MRTVFFLFFGFFTLLGSAQPGKTLSDAEILRLYEGLRVADVSDGMDAIGLHDCGLLDPSITALWKDPVHFAHRMTGIALTVRYVPTNRVFPTGLSLQEYEKWRDEWYTRISPEPFVDSIRQGSIIVIDNQGDNDTGTTGSNNILYWKKKGAVGVLSAGGVRDTDEISKEQVPVYMDIMKRGRGIRPGRNEVESVNRPVVVGGVLIRPGDVIVADGDGVIVVPREHSAEVARIAREVLNADKKGRRSLYDQLQIPYDFTVE